MTPQATIVEGNAHSSQESSLSEPSPPPPWSEGLSPATSVSSKDNTDPDATVKTGEHTRSAEQNSVSVEDSSQLPPAYPKTVSSTSVFAEVGIEVTALKFDRHKGSLHYCRDQAEKVQQLAARYELLRSRAADQTMAIFGERVNKAIAHEVEQSRRRLIAAIAELKEDFYIAESSARKTLLGVADKDFLLPRRCAGGCSHVHLTRVERLAQLEDDIGRTRSVMLEACGELNTGVTWTRRALRVYGL